MAYLGGVSTKHLQYVLEYIYLGEVNIAHENVDMFLEHAKKFKLQGFQVKKESEEVQETLLVKEEYVESFENTQWPFANNINGDNETENRTFSFSESNKQEHSNQLINTETHAIDQPYLNIEDKFSDVDSDTNIDDLLADDDNDDFVPNTKPVIMNCHQQWEDKFQKMFDSGLSKLQKKGVLNWRLSKYPDIYPNIHVS